MVYVPTLPENFMRRGLFLVFAMMCFAFANATASAQDDAAVREIYSQIAGKRAEIAAAENEITSATNAVVEAETEVATARSQLSTAESERRRAQDRSLSSLSAASYLSGSQEALNSLRQELSSASSEAERNRLRAQIRSLSEQLDEEAQRYARASNLRLEDINRTVEAVERARQQLRTAEQRLEAANGSVSRTQDRAQALQEELGQLLERAAAVSETEAPGFLQSVRVTQDGNEIYRASWQDNTEAYELLLALIRDLETQLSGLNDIEAQLRQERVVYQRTVNTAVNELPGLREELEWNDSVIYWSDNLYNLGQVLLLVASPASIVQGVYKGTTTMLAVAADEGLVVTRMAIGRFIARETVRQTALNVGLTIGPSGLPNILEWPAYARRVQVFFGSTAQLRSAELMLAQASRLAEPTAALLSGYQMYSGASSAADGSLFAHSRQERYNDADQRRFDERMRRAVRRVEAYNTDVLDFTASINARRQYEMQASAIAGWALEDLNSAIRDRENSWARTLLVGHIWETNADIAMAYDLAQIRYWESMRDGYRHFVSMVDDDLERLQALRRTTTDRVRELREELPGAAVREMVVHVNNRLVVRGSGEARIEVEFTQPLADPPTVQIGGGPAVAVNNGPVGNGLPLPDIEGAVLANMSGAGISWSGTFALRPLRGLVNSGEPLPVGVLAIDAAGRLNDADPRTAARTNAGGYWTYSEEARGAPNSGLGGEDRWHELNATQTGGTSYMFVVDASGSMEGEGLENVRRSARSFLASMNDRDEIAVYAFFSCGDVRLLQDFTRDKSQVLSVIDGIQHNSSTALAEAISLAGDYLLEAAHFDRRSLIVLTDGEQTCEGGNPEQAAARFRDRADILGDISNSHADGAEHSTSDAAPSETPQPAEEQIVEVQPDERVAWRVEQTGRGELPTFVLVETRFREWGRDNECAAQVTENKFYTYYGQTSTADGETRRSFGQNQRAFSSDTLDFAMCIRSQSGMDRIRSEWAQLSGSDYQSARAEAQRLAFEALD